MPIDPGTTTPIFIASLAANAQIGSSATQLASGLAFGLFQYTQSGMIVTSIDAGTLGVGIGIGPSVILAEPILLAALTASFIGHGIVGPIMPLQANAVALGVSASLALAIINTISPLVGLGAGKLQLIPNGTGGLIFTAAFKEAGLIGSSSMNMATAIGLALDAVMPSATGVIAIVGPPSIAPGVCIG